MENIQGVRNLILTGCIILFSLIQVIVGVDFYCDNKNRVSIEGTTNGTIVTRLSGSTHYDNSLSCEWYIKAASANAYIHLSVTSSDLQWAPIGSICVGYDYVQVFDGRSTKDHEILTWCGEENPNSVTSSGQDLLIKFVSNDRNLRNFAGVHIEFNVYEQSPNLGHCPPGWHDNQQIPNGGESCYSLKTVPETWTKAQEHCNYDNANLVSLETREEEKFIVGMVQNSSTISEFDTVWISLNDIEVDGTYRWLDGTKPTFYSWASDEHKAEGYYNCIQLDKLGKWSEAFCNENDIQSTVLHDYICERKKVGKTTIYEIPSTRTDRGGKNSSSPEKTFIIIGSLLGLAVLFVIIAVAVVCTLKKRKANNKGWRQPRTAHDDDSHSNEPIRSQEEARQPATAPPYTGSNQSLTSRNQAQPTVVLVFPSSDPPPPYEESQPTDSNATRTSAL